MWLMHFLGLEIRDWFVFDENKWFMFCRKETMYLEEI